MKKDTKQFFLTFFRSKNRGRETDMRYFNHPFAQDNQMDLISDINLDKSLSIESLSSDFEGVVEFSNKKGKRNAKDREVIDDDNNSSLKDVFDMDALLT